MRCVGCKNTPKKGAAVCARCIRSLEIEHLCAEQIETHAPLETGSGAPGVVFADDWEHVAALVDQWGRAHCVWSGAPIGRSNDAIGVRILEQSVSSEHAELEYTSDGWVVHDLESTNGTRVNDATVAQSCPVRHGDRITFGRVMFFFLLDGFEAYPSLGAAIRVSTVPLHRRRIKLDVAADPDDGGILRCGTIELQLPAIEFAFLRELAGDSSTARAPGAWVSTAELIRLLPWTTSDAGANQLHQRVHSLRNRSSKAGLNDFIESSRSLGYRLKHGLYAETLGRVRLA